MLRMVMTTERRALGRFAVVLRKDPRMSRPVRRVCLTAAVTVTAGLSAAPAYAATAGTGVGPLSTAASCSQAYLPLPDPACTPGAKNPDVTQSTIGSTICVSGWTATIRPSTSYTNGLKKQGIIDYGYTDTSMSDYEEDHFLPLELGGAPKDPRNLWPEPHSGSPNSYSKDSVENAVKKAVCAGQVTLEDAQNAMLDDWTTAKSALGIS
ncbi:hypothetical protein [Amycolatopsis sp. Hca4]|uniref:hypothetical protein n=1 Tax=Amycolatopsis sp. Hca4 TaxID=2742131 RepID=UPI0020CB318A|nr:hypothetical protein [Amycolatopsis sp. Hca4]